MIHAVGGTLFGIVWGWVLVLVASPARRRGRAVAILSASSVVVALGVLAVHTAPSALWFTAGTLIGVLAHAAWRHTVRRYVNGGMP